jgi:hypothetical protein
MVEVPFKPAILNLQILPSVSLIETTKKVQLKCQTSRFKATHLRMEYHGMTSVKALALW